MAWSVCCSFGGGGSLWLASLTVGVLLRILGVAALLPALLGVPIAIEAQEPDITVAVGDRVRLRTTTYAYPVEVWIVEMDSVAVTVLGADGNATRTPRTEILGAEVQVGRGTRRVVQATLIGAGAFAGVGLFVPLYEGLCGTDTPCPRWKNVLAATAHGALIGGALGLLTNFVWVPVTLGVSPSAFLPGRLDAGVTVVLGGG